MRIHSTKHCSKITAPRYCRRRNPLEKSINRVLVGITLTAITLNFGLLNYIFPTIGTMLLLLVFVPYNMKTSGSKDVLSSPSFAPHISSGC